MWMVPSVTHVFGCPRMVLCGPWVVFFKMVVLSGVPHPQVWQKTTLFTGFYLAPFPKQNRLSIEVSTSTCFTQCKAICQYVLVQLFSGTLRCIQFRYDLKSKLEVFPIVPPNFLACYSQNEQRLAGGVRVDSRQVRVSSGRAPVAVTCQPTALDRQQVRQKLSMWEALPCKHVPQCWLFSEWKNVR